MKKLLTKGLFISLLLSAAIQSGAQAGSFSDAPKELGKAWSICKSIDRSGKSRKKRIRTKTV